MSVMPADAGTASVSFRGSCVSPSSENLRKRAKDSNLRRRTEQYVDGASSNYGPRGSAALTKYATPKRWLNKKLTPSGRLRAMPFSVQPSSFSLCITVLSAASADLATTVAVSTATSTTLSSAVREPHRLTK